MINLPNEIKALICAHDEKLWVQIAILDPSFYEYTRLNSRQFINLFTKYVNKTYKTVTMLFGKKQSIYDQPSVEYHDGQQIWYQRGNKHRDNDLPAELYKGQRCWYQYGEIHRANDLPAIITISGNEHWYKYGLSHRDNDLPADIYANGRKCWYIYGREHRENDQPAIIDNGISVWYYFGKLHRETRDENGKLLPAIIRADGELEYYLFDNQQYI